MICIIANTMAAMRITFLNVCNEALVRNNTACLQAITRLAFENLHEHVSVACLNFLVRMPRHRLLAFRAIRPLDDIVHRYSTVCLAGAQGPDYATFATAVSICSHLGQTKVSSS